MEASACPDDRVDTHDLGSVVYDVGDQACGAKRLLAEQRVFGVGDAAVVRVSADDEQLINKCLPGLGGQAGDLGAGGCGESIW
ncbi:hypothetical protein [Microbispora bryophytorum]|uniref:hypothetical protein n=1 Tax=Microbispora bryophytorum TaxID=1460882 RepID=UPI0033D0F700